MTDKEAADIAARLAAATPGPWECCNAGGTYPTGEVISLHRVRSAEPERWLIAESRLDADQKPHDEQDANMEVIAHAPEDLAALLAERTARQEIVRSVATSNPYGSWLPPTNRPAGVVCRWCMERAYTPAEVQHDAECTWRRARALLAAEGETQP